MGGRRRERERKGKGGGRGDKTSEKAHTDLPIIFSIHAMMCFP